MVAAPPLAAADVGVDPYAPRLALLGLAPRLDLALELPIVHVAGAKAFPLVARREGVEPPTF